MKILSTTAFNEKVTTLNSISFKELLLSFIDKVNKGDNYSELLNQSKKGFDDVYVYKLGNYRLFFTIYDNEDTGKSVLLIDFIYKGYDPQQITNKNIILNSYMNPKFNSIINPNFNSNINPKFNSVINPTFNSNINPKFNSLINPTFNSNINPKFNSLINPTFNSNINPKFNSAINPLINPSYEGLFIYNLDLKRKEFMIIVNENIIQIFDFKLNNIRYGVKHLKNGYIIYNLNGAWISHMEFDSQNGYNDFDLNNNWINIVK